MLQTNLVKCVARVTSGKSRVQNGGVRAARIIRQSQDEPCTMVNNHSNNVTFVLK